MIRARPAAYDGGCREEHLRTSSKDLLLLLLLQEDGRPMTPIRHQPFVMLPLYLALTIGASAAEVHLSESVRADIEGGKAISPADPPSYVVGTDSDERASILTNVLRKRVSKLDYIGGRTLSFASPRIGDVLKSISSAGGSVTIDRAPELQSGPTYRATLRPFSKNARRLHNVPQLSSQYGLSGKGVGVGIWDQGSVLATHVEFDDRVEVRDPDLAPSDHATQVAGDVAASGNKDKGGEPDAEGVAPASRIYSYSWKNDLEKLRNVGKADLKVSITNHSYSTTQGWSYMRAKGLWGWYGDPRKCPTEDYKFGKYVIRSSTIDEVIASYPRLSVFVAAGNNRNPKSYPKEADDDWAGLHWLPILNERVDGPIRPPDRQHDGGYDTLEDLGVAKNVITIGAMEDIPAPKELAPENVVVTEYSNWGPTDDGRIKPDLVANGSDLRTPVVVQNGTTYDTYAHGNKDGTSMASPTAAGVGALLNELSVAKRGSPLRGDEMKAVLIATAVSPTRGPNYRTGWGAIDALAAGRMVAGDAGSLITVTASSPQTELKLVRSSGPMSLTIVWIDPAAGANAGGLNDRAPVLKLDLDLELIDAAGKLYFPWSLDVEHPSRDATNAGPNNRDNVERIDVDDSAATAGAWLARIKAPAAAHRASGRNGHPRISNPEVGRELVVMRVSVLHVLANILTAILAFTTFSARAETLSDQDIYDKRSSSLVFFRSNEGKDMSFGVLIGKDGYVLTAKHVVVAFGGEPVKGTIGSKGKGKLLEFGPAEDGPAGLDVSLLKMKSPPKDLSPAPIGRTDHFKASTRLVIVTGRNDQNNAVPLSATVSNRADSAMGRWNMQGPGVEPGNSGSPAFDDRGNVVGFVVAGYKGLGTPQLQALDELIPWLKDKAVSVEQKVDKFAIFVWGREQETDRGELKGELTALAERWLGMSSADTPEEPAFIAHLYAHYLAPNDKALKEAVNSSDARAWVTERDAGVLYLYVLDWPSFLTAGKSGTIARHFVVTLDYSGPDVVPKYLRLKDGKLLPPGPDIDGVSVEKTNALALASAAAETAGRRFRKNDFVLAQCLDTEKTANLPADVEARFAKWRYGAAQSLKDELDKRWHLDPAYQSYRVESRLPGSCAGGGLFANPEFMRDDVLKRAIAEVIIEAAVEGYERKKGLSIHWWLNKLRAKDQRIRDESVNVHLAGDDFAKGLGSDIVSHWKDMVNGLKP